jgi:hypothetical protein
MNIKFLQVKMALEHLRDKIGSEKSKDLILEVDMTEDDPGAGKLVASMMIKCATVEQPSKYDSIKSPIHKEYSMEIFADNEGRAPRLTVNETRDLEE